MKHKKYTYLLKSLLYFFCLPIKATDIGSNTAVLRVNTQQTINNGDVVQGFAALAGGFKLSSSAVTGIWNSFFPVSGAVDFNHGTMVLTRDLDFSGVTNFQRFGNIFGNGYTVDWTPTMTAIPTSDVTSLCFTYSTVNVFLNANVTLQNTCLLFTGNSTLNGQGNCLTLNSTSTLQIGANSNLLIKDITIINVQDSNIQCLNDLTSTITYKNVELVLSGNYTFTQGSFQVFQDLHIVGQNHSFVYQSDQASVINSTARLILDMGVTFSYAPRSANRDLISMVDSSAQLILNGATLYSTTTGMRLTNGTILVDSNSFLSSDGSVDSQAISFGNGIAANNVTLEFLPAAQLEILRGRVVYASSAITL